MHGGQGQPAGTEIHVANYMFTRDADNSADFIIDRWYLCGYDIMKPETNFDDNISLFTVVTRESPVKQELAIRQQGQSTQNLLLQVCLAFLLSY